MLSVKIEPLLEHNWSHQDIADAFGVTRARVTQIANELGYGVKRPKHTLTEETWAKLLSEYPRLTITELHRKYEISRAAIYRRLKHEYETRTLDQLQEHRWVSREVKNG